MIIDIILGKNIDTKMWINDLKENGADQVIVVDYEYGEGFEEIDGTIYMAPFYAQRYAEKFDTKNYYKSMYVFPGGSSTKSASDHRGKK